MHVSIKCLLLLALQLQLTLRLGFCGRPDAVVKDEYSDSFSVEIVGGAEEADEIAKRRGFRNRGKV